MTSDNAISGATLLANRVAVVTGGAGGIGAATARLFAQHGADVVIADIDSERAQQTADAISESGGSAAAFVTDVRHADQVARLAHAVLDRHGRVDVLVNNVGHWLRHPGDFVDTDAQLWDELYRVNLHHVFLVTHAFLPAMIDRHAGAIVNVSSVEGLRGYPEDPVYAAFNTGQCDRARRHRVTASAVLAVVVSRRAVAVAAVGARRAHGAAGRPRPGDPVPGLRTVGLRHRPHHPDRRRHRRSGWLVSLITPARPGVDESPRRAVTGQLGSRNGMPAAR
jgi:2-hydroxycyclohexanecarboxyl-CoA dehydrogenase